jgi:single-strand DNA-binding protein
MVNKVILIGNLGKDPEVKYLEGNVAVARLSVATNESYKDKKGDWQTQTEWHDIVAWRQLAERCEKGLKKGQQVYVEGKLTHRKYQDKDGNDRYATEVVANTIRLLEKKEGGSSNAGQQSGTPSAESNYANSGGQSNQADDDLPF